MQITEEVRKYLSELGKKGGKIGGKISRGGGRPMIPDNELTPLQRKRRERYLKMKAEKATVR
jgi:hypothetical protein